MAAERVIKHDNVDSETQYMSPRSLKSVLVLPPHIFGPFGPPKKRVNFDKFSQRHKVRNFFVPHQVVKYFLSDPGLLVRSMCLVV